jgi:hypothetical protein
VGPLSKNCSRRLTSAACRKEAVAAWSRVFRHVLVLSADLIRS